MKIFFAKRLLRNKNFYFSLLISNCISILYVLIDVYPTAKYGGSPYTRWIGSFTGSQIPAIFFLLLPLIASLGFSNTYLDDKKTGLINIIISKGLQKEYFKELFIFNFFVGGFCFTSGLITNIYGCFMLLQNRQVDMLVNGNGNVPLLFSNTMFPNFYYSHPFLHMMIYVILSFVIAGLFSSLALSLSFVISKTFIVFLAPFIINYIYNMIIPAFPESNSLLFTVYAKQISSPIISPIIILISLISFFIVCISLYFLGNKKYVYL